MHRDLLRFSPSPFRNHPTDANLASSKWFRNFHAQSVIVRCKTIKGHSSLTPPSTRRVYGCVLTGVEGSLDGYTGSVRPLLSEAASEMRNGMVLRRLIHLATSLPHPSLPPPFPLFLSSHPVGLPCRMLATGALAWIACRPVLKMCVPMTEDDVSRLLTVPMHLCCWLSS